MNGRSPVEVWPLASFLADEMQARGWKAEDVAARMVTADGFGHDLLSLNLVLCVHKDSLVIDDETFEALARSFGVSSDYFRRLDTAWRGNPSARVAWECPDELFGLESRRALIRSV
jgi:hypothetical protein